MLLRKAAHILVLPLILGTFDTAWTLGKLPPPKTFKDIQVEYDLIRHKVGTVAQKFFTKQDPKILVTISGPQNFLKEDSEQLKNAADGFEYAGKVALPILRDIREQARQVLNLAKNQPKNVNASLLEEAETALAIRHIHFELVKDQAQKIDDYGLSVFEEYARKCVSVTPADTNGIRVLTLTVLKSLENGEYGYFSDKLLPLGIELLFPNLNQLLELSL